MSIWPRALIESLILEAECAGFSKAILGSHREAVLFRHAVVNHKRSGLGKDIMTRIFDNEVHFFLKPKVRIAAE
jgi:hypothetical protein